LQMLTQNMQSIGEHQSSLDLEISHDQSMRFAESYMRQSKSKSDHRLVKGMSSILLAPNEGRSDNGVSRSYD
jgi:hypothetical protein